MQRLADTLDNYIYPLLVFTVAIIPLHQWFADFFVTALFLLAIGVTIFKSENKHVAILKPWQQGLLYLMLIISVISIHFSLNKAESALSWSYSVGQYISIVYVLLRYGWKRPQVFGKSASDSREQENQQQETTGLQEEDISFNFARMKALYVSLPRPLQLIATFLLVSIVVSLIGIAQKVLGITAEGIWVDPEKFPDLKVRVYSTLVNPNILAGYLVLVISYAVGFFNVAKGKRNLRLVLLAIAGLAAVCLLYTYSRGNWIACAAMLLAFCILFCHKAFVPVLGSGALGLALGGQAVMNRITSIGSTEDTSTALRMAYLKSTKWIIEEFPLGVGWSGYRFVYPTYNFYLADKSVIMWHCHNIFLNTLAELGWHGLIVFLAVWGMFIYNAWQLAYRGRTLWLKGMGRGYILASVGIAIGGLTDHVYFNTQMGVFFWMIGILTMICAKQNHYEA